MVVMMTMMMHVFALPLINHRGVVLAIHGLMDHAEIGELQHLKAEAVRSYDAYARDHDPNLSLSQLLQQSPDDAPHVARSIAEHVDLNGDQRIFLPELASFMVAMVQDHERRGILDSMAAFYRFGVVRVSVEEIQAHRHAAMTETDLKSFHDADCDGDERLTQEEFLDFNHPEHSAVVKERFAVRFMLEHDLNNDSFIDLPEFLNKTLEGKSEGEVPWSEQAFDFRSEKQERLREFHEDIDLDHDNRLNPTEVLRLLQPDHITHVLGEAHDLLKSIDENDDHELSYDEFMDGINRVAQSKFFNFGVEAHNHVNQMSGPRGAWLQVAEQPR